jgi:hypothetical protein
MLAGKVNDTSGNFVSNGVASFGARIGYILRG